ncbi:MAG: phosphatidylglycerophosphatase A [Peptococcaceae bacterium]|nr:phosphatidylglycerophosphatase A [Peptococcaceae bacterium]
MKDTVIRMFSERGVDLGEVAELVLELQKPYHPTLSISECLENVEAVLQKREVQQAIITGIVLDTLAEQGLLPEPLQTLLVEDEPLYGVDEILALAITNVYGAIGFTNFGYLDKTKPGILRRLNSHPHQVHTFMDDLVAGLAAAASARLAHNLEKIVP